jgi:hypothetical protein
MSQTTLISSITRTGTYPVSSSITAENNCAMLSLILTSTWTEQMIHELPNINIAFYADSNIKIASIDVDMTTVNNSVGGIEPIQPYTIPIQNVPSSFVIKITPLFDKYALSAHNATVETGNISNFGTIAGIVDTDINDYSSELWTTPTQTFDISIVFDDTNFVAGGGSGGGGTPITIDTQVMQGSTNPVQNGAIYSFVNSSVSTNTANYISDNGEPFTSVQDLENYSGTVTNNDYAFVTGTDQDGNTYYDRYKATVSDGTVTWSKEYRLNNSSFTANQWDTINSGLSASDKMIAGDGVSITQGSNSSTISIDAATTSSIGGVIVGDGLSVSDGNISVNVDSEFNASSQNPISNQFLTNFFTAMTQAQYDALSTKTLPLYFVYEM